MFYVVSYALHILYPVGDMSCIAYLYICVYIYTYILYIRSDVLYIMCDVVCYIYLNTLRNDHMYLGSHEQPRQSCDKE